MSVYRCFTEKRAGFDTDARGLLSDLRDFLGTRSVERLRIFNRYDIEGVTSDEYAAARDTILSEPQTDDVYDENLPEMPDARLLAIESLPGQYDQRADSCAQCIQMITRQERPNVLTAKVYAFFGSVSDDDLARLRGYLINPVESREASHEKPDTLAAQYPEPEPVRTVDGFIAADDASLGEFLESYGLAMDISDLKFMRDYFRNVEKRDPTVTEIRVIDTYWSDHCRHTTFGTELESVSIDDAAVLRAYDAYLELRREVYGDSAEKRPQTLMDIATIGAKALKRRGLLQNIDESEEVNACSIHVAANIDGQTEDWLLMFKNETHNHPTEIEPYGGAATCIGGAIRDPLSGRAYVYQAMRVTGSGDPRAAVSDTLPGKLPQRKLTTTAAKGYSSYGNQIGLATGLVHEIYHPGYIAKRMEIGAVVGAAPAKNVIRKTPQPGDCVILLGGRTGRDGIGGATGSSKSHTKESLVTMASEVQKGNAPEERKLQRLFLDPEVTQMIKRCNDFGAGGISVAIGELADGLDIDLSRVRKKYEGLGGTELAISESQERMAVVVAASDVDAFIKKAEGENLEGYVVAEVTESPRMVMRFGGDVICDLSREFLSTNGAPKQTSASVPQYAPIRPQVPDGTYAARLRAMASDLRYCSQRGLYELFDGSVGASSVTMKLGGVTQSTPVQAMAALLPVQTGETSTCSVMSFGFDPYLSSANPYEGAKTAVITSLAKLVAAGCDPDDAYLTFQEYFERLRDEPLRWGKPLAALLGALDAQIGLETAAIGGKDSMSGSFNELDVPPTLVSFAVAPCDAACVITPEFKSPGHDVVLFPASGTLGGTKDMWRGVCRLVRDGTVVSAWAVTDGGAADGIFKMTLGNEIGFETDSPDALFDYVPGSIVAEITRAVAGTVTLGRTVHTPDITLGGERVTLSELKALWEGTLEGVFPTKTFDSGEVRKISYDKRPAVVAAQSFARPRVLVMSFPGTNSEIDTARAVERAGGEARILVVRNLTAGMLEQSVGETVRAISDSQIIIIPGGFSGGDEPDGSAKFITAFFRSPAVADAIRGHLSQRDGLMLGICNGFQALIKLGLVPYGDIVTMTRECPTLTFNTLGRHQARYAYTRVASVCSPWMNLSNVGDVHAVAFSHGEGRFAASESLLRELETRGGIATQYTNSDGIARMEVDVNPNGSVMAVEGLFSPDGRVFGKMGHTERRGGFVAKNIYGNKHQPVIESGVRYYK